MFILEILGSWTDIMIIITVFYTSLLAEKRNKNKNLKTTKPLELIDLNMSVHVKHIPETDQTLGLDLSIGPSPENFT